MFGCPTLAAFLLLRLGWKGEPLLCLRSRRPDRLRSIELLEVLLKARRQLGSRLVVSCFVGPCIARIQNLRRNIGAAHRNAQPKRRLGHKLHLAQPAVERRIHQRARNLQAHALAHAKLAAAPAGVHQPARSLMLRQPLAQHLRINPRRQRQKRRAKASRKLRHGVLAHPRLGSPPPWPCTPKKSDTPPPPASAAKSAAAPQTHRQPGTSRSADARPLPVSPRSQ